jgi:hypothetical protein
MVLAHHQVRTQLQAPIEKKEQNRWEVAQNRNTKKKDAQTAP